MGMLDKGIRHRRLDGTSLTLENVENISITIISGSIVLDNNDGRDGTVTVTADELGSVDIGQSGSRPISYYDIDASSGVCIVWWYD